MIRKVSLFALICLGAVMFFGCGSDSGGGTEPEPTPPPRIIAELHSDPGIASVNSVVWDSIDSASFPIGNDRTGDYNANIGWTDSKTMSMKALYTATHIYLRAQWTDNDADTFFAPYKAYEYSGDTYWEELDTLQTYNEDRLYVMFDRGGPEGADCALMCHASGDTSTAGRRMYATSNANAADVWHWKAMRTGFANLADDGILSDTAIADDPQANSSDFLYKRNNVFEGDPQLPARPIYMHETDTAYDGAALLETEATNLTFTTYDADLFWFDIVINPGSVDTVGKYMPGYILYDSTGNDGSRWDVQTVQDHSAGMWTVIMRRALEPSGTEDIDFDFATTDSIHISVAVADNSGIQHHGKEPFYLIIQK